MVIHLKRDVSCDDAASKTRGGRIGWQHAEYEKNSRSQRAPSEVLEAAFAMKIGEISAPIKTRNGYYLVWLSGIEPQPERATLHRRLLGELSAEYSRELVKAAKVQMLIK